MLFSGRLRTQPGPLQSPGAAAPKGAALAPALRGAGLEFLLRPPRYASAAFVPLASVPGTFSPVSVSISHFLFRKGNLSRADGAHVPLLLPPPRGRDGELGSLEQGGVGVSIPVQPQGNEEAPGVFFLHPSLLGCWGLQGPQKPPRVLAGELLPKTKPMGGAWPPAPEAKSPPKMGHGDEKPARPGTGGWFGKGRGGTGDLVLVCWGRGARAAVSCPHFNSGAHPCPSASTALLPELLLPPLQHHDYPIPLKKKLILSLGSAERGQILLRGADTSELLVAFCQRCLFGAENGLLCGAGGAGGSSGRIHVSGCTSPVDGRTDGRTDGRLDAVSRSRLFRCHENRHCRTEGRGRSHPHPQQPRLCFPPSPWGLPEIPPCPALPGFPARSGGSPSLGCLRVLPGRALPLMGATNRAEPGSRPVCGWGEALRLFKWE